MESREVHLAKRPEGWPTPDVFRIVTVDCHEPAAGDLLVRNLVMSVDPYMRGRMNDDRAEPIPPYELDQPLDGLAVGEVVASGMDEFRPGDVVQHGLGWREYALVPATQARKVDVTVAPPSAYLGALGLPGLAAYAGLLDIAGMRPGETVFVSAAAGAVGCLAAQIAKLRGAARVVGSAGSAAKVSYLTDDLGLDAAFDYHDGPAAELLRQIAGDGIDVYFDNVGGEQLEAAIGLLKPFGRVAVCGAISQYNTSNPTGPRNLSLAVSKRLTLRGFIVIDHADRLPVFLEEVTGWLRAGQIRMPETFFDGIEQAPDAFLGMLRGQNTGKMLVRLS